MTSLLSVSELFHLLTMFIRPNVSANDIQLELGGTSGRKTRRI
jgi:hypothetical protein